MAYAVAAVAGTGFLGMLLLMQLDPDDFARIDAIATALAHHLQTITWAEVLIVITTLGSTTSIIALAVLVAVFLRHTPTHLRQLLVLMLAESASVELLKPYIGRIRPEALPWIGPLHSFSFPSGHATASMALFGFIAILGAERIKNRTLRYGFLALLLVLITAIGISRIVLGAHYASDVIAGYLLGAFWVAVVYVFVR